MKDNNEVFFKKNSCYHPLSTSFQNLIDNNKRSIGLVLDEGKYCEE